MASPPKLQDILDFLGRMAPWDLAEPWDNVGLMVGDPGQTIRGVLVALDPTTALADEALTQQADLIITHHPLIFKPLKAIDTATSIGKLLKKLLQHDIALVSCHTNLDIIADGVSEVLAALLGLQKTMPLVPGGRGENEGFGRIGELDAPMARDAFLRHVAEQLRLPALALAGTPPQRIQRVALCGGSGSEFAETAMRAGADLYITAELKHSVARWAEENGLCVIDAGHFATENVVVPMLVDRLTTFFHERNHPVPVRPSRLQGGPISIYFPELETANNFSARNKH